MIQRLFPHLPFYGSIQSLKAPLKYTLLEKVKTLLQVQGLVREFEEDEEPGRGTAGSAGSPPGYPASGPSGRR